MSEPDTTYDDEPDRSGSADGPTDGPSNQPTDGPSDRPAGGPAVVEVPTGAGTARLDLPSDATDDEVAALVAAVTARLTARTPDDDRDVAMANPWRLAARLGVRRRVELPRACRRGGEWAAAARRP